MVFCYSETCREVDEAVEMILFTVQELLEITGGTLLSPLPSGSRDVGIRRLCTDSRLTRVGDLYIALLGEQFDGHQFVTQALEAGAGGALIQSDQWPRVEQALGATECDRDQAHDDPRLMIGVTDPLRALQDLAAYHRHRFDLPLVVMTGSNGKTTSKEMTAQVLGQRWKTLKTEGNLNNRIGVPKTLLRLTSATQAAVIEMGVDQQHQTTRLCEIASPTIGVITNIGPDHLEFFGSLEGSAQAKAELVDWMPDEGAMVLNADDSYFEELASRASCRVVSFGLTCQGGHPGR